MANMMARIMAQLALPIESGTSESTESVSSDVAQAMGRVQAEMDDLWRKDDQLIEKFFPVEPSLMPKIEVAQKRSYNVQRCHWKAIPSAPKQASALYTPLRKLMNDILLIRDEPDNTPRPTGVRQKKGNRNNIFPQRKKALRQKKGALQTTNKPFRPYGDPRQREHARRIFATHSKHKRIQGIPPCPISPTLYLAGASSNFFGFVGPVEATGLNGISPIEVVLDSDNARRARDRLAVNMSQMFCSQSRRRFAYGLILTETTCTVYMFDHSGAVASQPLKYHQEPAQFCAIIYGLGTCEGERAGFDMTVTFNGRFLTVRTLEERDGKPKDVGYGIKDGIFRFHTLVGRGTVCWLGLDLDRPDTQFVIKDSWIPREELPGRESEASLLRHAHAKGIVTGVIQLHHAEEVRRSGGPEDLDTVLRNRKVDNPTSEDLKLDRIHTRLVLKTCGKRLEYFSTRKELLLAFYDAVLAHRKLYEVAGILHRDISPGNILINPNGVVGDRGILIDFDHAIRVGDTSPYSTKKKIGTYRFMSRNALDGAGPHTYLDDLESFYFVLCWIITVFSGPGMPKSVIPKLVNFWDQPSAASLKRAHFFWKGFELPVDPWFGPAFLALATRLYGYFVARLDDSDSDNEEASLSFALNPQKDYEDFLMHIEDCIADIDAEDTRTAIPSSL